MRVLAIGECMAELVPTDTEGDLRLGFAGDTFNTAWYLARCAPDAHVSYLTVLGDDAISQKMAAFMCDSGIDDRFVQVAKGRTVGLYMITLDEGERSFSYWRGILTQGLDQQHVCSIRCGAMTDNLKSDQAILTCFGGGCSD